MQQNQTSGRQYFFVSRGYRKENAQTNRFLWAPAGNRYKTINTLHVGDAIILYNSKPNQLFVGIGIASNDPHQEICPYNENDEWKGKSGYQVDFEPYIFSSPVSRKEIAASLLQVQPSERNAPLDKKGNPKTSYLTKANASMVEIILQKALEIDHSSEQAEIIKKIREATNMEVPPTSMAGTHKDASTRTPLQKIFFGAPGTGKSFEINERYGIEERIKNGSAFRTTFHPDYDYAQFVGAYKPRKEGVNITYSFVPQVFAKAYATAWKLQLSPAENADNNVYLVIEEINRGNCAQIFGDIFQLLDRDAKGYSEYAVDADCDFAEWLEKESALKEHWNVYKDKVGEGKLKFPPNLNILATMNTSDQSLFPMDSAFKRRFDWEYMPIDFKDKDAAYYKIRIGDADGDEYPWQKFVEEINKKILDLTESEDKQLGEFFVKLSEGYIISREQFLGKVMFYLWNEVCKDEHKHGSFFCKDAEGKDSSYFTFQDLYRDDDLLKRFMDNLLKEKKQQA